jgi:hypothetical protein
MRGAHAQPACAAFAGEQLLGVDRDRDRPQPGLLGHGVSLRNAAKRLVILDGVLCGV